jgi:hypothetical protein
LGSGFRGAAAIGGDFHGLNLIYVGGQE